MIRIKEVSESLRIVGHCLAICAPMAHSTTPGRTKFTGMEELIEHFKAHSEGVAVPAGMGYAVVESPKGELGVVVLSDGSPRPYRVSVRSPVAHNMHMLPSLAAGATFADFVAAFCSLDIVLGEIDR